MSRLAEQEVAREARRILRRLAAPRQFLLARDNGDYAVARSPAALAASRVATGGDFVEAFARAGWIAPDGAARFVIAQAGLDFLTRSFGGEDGFAAQHRLIHSIEGDDARIVTVNAGESPLARLKFRGLVDALQFAAGERLRRDFTQAQMTPRMGVNLAAPVVSGGRGPSADTASDLAIAARQRLNRALAAVGPELGDVLFDVCCHLTQLERAESSRGWSKRSGRVVLKIALDRLAAHYGMGVTVRRSPIRAWKMDESAAP